MDARRTILNPTKHAADAAGSVDYHTRPLAARSDPGPVLQAAISNATSPTFEASLRARDAVALAAVADEPATSYQERLRRFWMRWRQEKARSEAQALRYFLAERV